MAELNDDFVALARLDKNHPRLQLGRRNPGDRLQTPAPGIPDGLVGPKGLVDADGSSDEIAGDDVPNEVVRDDPAQLPLQNNDVVDGDDNNRPNVGEEIVAPPAPPDAPDFILGQRVKVLPAIHGDGYNQYARWRVKCPVHEKCYRSRSTELFRNSLGEMSAAYFLGAWIQRAAILTFEQHKLFKPDVGDMQAFRDAHVDGFQ